MRRAWDSWTAIASALAFSFSAPPLHAKVSSEVQYSLSQVYSGALRYLRIDLGYEITERDPDTAYLLFTFKAPGKRDNSFGAIEMVKTEKQVRLVVNLPQLPSYHEAVLRDGLLKKLQEDYGIRETAPGSKGAGGDAKAPEKPKHDRDKQDPPEAEAPGKAQSREERAEPRENGEARAD